MNTHTMDRFADIDLGNRILPPFGAYWQHPLLPLDKAVEPIMPRIEKFQRTITEAKKNCRFPSEHGLTKDESAAVHLYTMEGGDTSFYRLLNKDLRSEDRSLARPWFAYLKLLDTAMEKLPNVKKNLWRGVKVDASKNFKKDQELVWWSVNSCSSSVDVIKKFIGTTKNATLFMIEAVNGKNLGGYSNFPDENEVLLLPGTRLRVEGGTFDHVGGLHVVHLVEVTDEQPSTTSCAGGASGKQQFTSPYSQMDLDCGGRACAKCGKCRDWYHYRYHGVGLLCRCEDNIEN